MGDGDVDARQGRGRGTGVGDDALRAPRGDLAHEVHERTGQVVGGDAVTHVPDERPPSEAQPVRAWDSRLT